MEYDTVESLRYTWSNLSKEEAAMLILDMTKTEEIDISRPWNAVIRLYVTLYEPLKFDVISEGNKIIMITEYNFERVVIEIYDKPLFIKMKKPYGFQGYALRFNMPIEWGELLSCITLDWKDPTIQEKLVQDEPVNEYLMRKRLKQFKGSLAKQGKPQKIEEQPLFKL